MSVMRSAMLSYLRAHVVGPQDGPNEVVREQPYKRYLMGTLYPADATSDEVLADEVEDSVGGSVGEELADDPVTLANSWLPSSIGISFYVGGAASLTCKVSGARYATERPERREVHCRVPIADLESAPAVLLERSNGSPANSRTSVNVLEDRARLEAFWRVVDDGYLVTVTLRNMQRQSSGGSATHINPELCLHQVAFECTPTDGVIREYPSVEFLSRDPEEAELRLLHRHARVFAIGHGCAANWATDAKAFNATSVSTELMPSFEVPPLVTGGGEDGILALARLADPTIPRARLVTELEEFAGHYESWIDMLPGCNQDIPAALSGARDSLIKRLRAVVVRIRRGIEVLNADDVVLRAFRLANLAMLMQMRHNQKDLAGERKVRDSVVFPEINYLSLDYCWRPFQLAFVLLTLSSVVYEDDIDRDVVDLLWFPTGGGKTEAYLAVAALDIFLRRLRAGDAGAGTTVITRYTLRLLASQQFQRAAALICAAELIRRDHANIMGITPISIGLWVGDAVTPNKYQKAAEKLTEVMEAPFPTSPFQLEQCPWCGTALVPIQRDEDVDSYGIRATQSSFQFFCPTAVCPFHAELPIAVVDEELYRRPPTFLLATVDKFARLAWEERGAAFFGGGGQAPPSLVIQDEMHLLSGPLGTTVGVYEAAIEALMAYHGGCPKIIASTATIRRARAQALGLFGRDVRLFPPPGLNASDSYFAKVDTSRPGRLYVGLMSQSHTPHTTIVHTAAALLQGPVELGATGGALDAYWTLVAYHNSLRELGRTVTLARDDIPARIKVIAQDEAKVRHLGDDTVVELTSNVNGADLPSLLERLKRRAGEPDTISALATTNMLSVGVDIPRLGLMLVNGQPKTTSEYIQATSRVGRGETPGLVIALYVSTKPRDRSHYESFLPYHAALYRHVEPTSVTPFSLPSRERALHAAFVILLRHGAGLSANDAAAEFRADDVRVAHAITVLEQRIKRVDPRELPAASRQLRELAARWESLADDTAKQGKKLYYQASVPHVALLKNFGEDGTGWATLHSMRNVDRQCTVTVIGEDKK